MTSPARSVSRTSFTESSGCVCVFSVTPPGGVQLQELVEVDPGADEVPDDRVLVPDERPDGSETVPP